MTSSIEDWLSRPGSIAVARLLHAAFFMTVAVYCFLSYSPFAYAQFIKPNVVPALNEFVVLSHWYFWVVLLTTLLTLTPQIRGGRGQGMALAYLLVMSAIGVVVLFNPPLATIGGSPRGFLVGLVALVPPIWLAAVDHLAQPAPEMRPTAARRALAACLWSALMVWAIYAIVAPLRLGQAVGIDLTPGNLAIGLGSSLVLDLYCFAALFLTLSTAMAVAGFTRTPSTVEYSLFVTVLAVCAALVVYLLVCESITFTGRDAAIASSALGVTFAAIWSDLARLRGCRRRSSDRLARDGLKAVLYRSAPIDSLAMFGAPIVGVRSSGAAIAALIGLPVAAYLLVGAVSHFDWNFLLQKLTVLAVWLATFTTISAMISGRRRNSPQALPYTGLLPLVVFGLYHLFVSLDAHSAALPLVPPPAHDVARLPLGQVLDRYAALDPSFRLIRDARTARSADTAEYYKFLRSHTFIPVSDIPPVDVDFVKPLGPTRDRPPDIFLFIVDSLRRDYLSPYNSAVTFTPAIARFGSESHVFDRAFTRYSGTALAVPSIWAGGMLPHSLEQPAFGRRNTLLKLLAADHYLRMMDIDHIVGDLVPSDPDLVQLDKGKGTMQFDLCATIGELESKLAMTDASRPVFFYSLPQNVHISIASSRKVPEGESYPGFFAPVASSVHRIDGCIGGFIEFLKRTNRFDGSIVILTSDHGDSLGEEGRWGHGHFIVPEVMRIPLIVHVPAALRARASVDLSALTFSTDITPSLYALLGYAPSGDDPLGGRSTFGAPDADTEWRRKEAFLLASSYGTTYGMLRQNGRRLYVVDAVDGHDSAFDVSNDAVGTRIDVTQEMTAENRIVIRQHLTELARRNQYQARP